METTGMRQYAIELFLNDQWQEFYRTPEKADAEGVWQRVLETQLQSEARLIEMEVLRSFAGDQGARKPDNTG